MVEFDHIVRILDGYANGTAIYFSSYNLLVTAEQFTRSGSKVTIFDQNNKASKADVVYINESLNVAFLKPSINVHFNSHSKFYDQGVQIQNKLNAVGFLPQFGLKSYATSLLVLDKSFSNSDAYIYHDAVLATSSLGGPLLSDEGKMLGINIRCNYGLVNGTLALSFHILQSLMDDYVKSNFKCAVICPECNHLIEDKNKMQVSCPNCKARVALISSYQPFDLSAINRKIEKILSNLGYDPVLCRSDMNNWVITKGSARIHLQYNTSSGIIVAESFLCKLYVHNKDAILEYLLKQNYHSRGYAFSIREDVVVLSLLIYDQFINQESAVLIFNKLLQTADLYDKILIERFGASGIELS
jgi:serine protease Do